MQGPLVMLASFGCLVYEHVHLANSSGHTLKIYTHFHMCYTLVKIVLKSLSSHAVEIINILLHEKEKKFLMLYKDVYLGEYSFQWPHYLWSQIMLSYLETT